MINKDKIILMTKLAVHDKKYGESDNRQNGFFRNEYVYWKNFWARTYALLGCFIIVGIYALNKIVTEEADLFEIDYKAEGIKVLTFIGIVMVIVTVLNGIKATREYTRVQERIKRQLEFTKRLDRISAKEKLENTLV